MSTEIELAPASVEAIAQRVTTLLLDRLGPSTNPRAIVPTAMYTAAEAASLIQLHADTIRKKLRAGIIVGRQRSGCWRVMGSELLRFAGTPSELLKTWPGR